MSQPQDLTGLGEIQALLGRGTAFEGTLAFEGRVRIDGRFAGKVFSEGILILGDGAEVDAEIEVGVRVEPGLEQMKALHRCDANVAVLHAGGLRRARGPAEQRAELVRLRDAATLAHKLNLRVAVAGGVDLRAAELLAQVPQITELHLGHACLARALLVGIERAVTDFAEAVARGRRQAD